jgi:hypothetical protein
MKKIILTTLVSAATLAVFAQGTVNFSNLSTALTSPPDRLVRFGTNGFGNPSGVSGAPAVTNVIPTLVAQLYYGSSTAVADSLVAVSTAPGTLRGSTSASAGTWFGNGTRTISGFNPGDTVNLQVRVWDISKGTDFLAATASANLPNYAGANGDWYGSSAIFQYTITTNPTPAPSEFNMNAFTGFSLSFVSVPEPSTLALAGLGAAGLLFIRRRK